MEISMRQLMTTQVSLFDKVEDSNKHSKTITLGQWFSPQYVNTYYNNVKYCRKLYKDYLDGVDTKTHYQDMKKKLLPLITPSCVFDGERSTNNEKHTLTGIICLDIDNIESEQKVEELKHVVIHLPYCFLVAKSVSGYGFFAFIAYNKENNFKGTFNSLKQDFENLGITLDSNCSDYTRARFMGLDTHVLCKGVDSDIQIYDKVVNEQTIDYSGTTIQDSVNLSNDDVVLLTKCIIYLIRVYNYGKSGFEYQEGHTKYDYYTWLLDSYRLSSLENYEVGLKLFTYISQNGDDYSNDDNVRRQFIACRNNNNGKCSVVYYFGLCKKLLGNDWKQIVEYYTK